MFKYGLIVCFLLFGALRVLAQTDSLKVYQIKGKSYYIHVVKKGESLYAIHKQYNVPIDVIKKENPGVLDGLSIDEKVYIPIKRNEASNTNIDGNYIEHTVLKKQTLYAIAKIYKVQQNEIIAANPELNERLKEGQIIKIPIKKLKAEAAQVQDTIVQTKQKTHVVKKGETLYFLSKTYDVGIDEIKAVNNGLPQGLREGETIFLPIKEKKTLELGGIVAIADSMLNRDTLERKPVYHIGLFLPFYLDENDEMVENRNALDERQIYPRSKFAIEFYNGFTRMLDSLSNDSATFKVFVYDTKGSDTSRIKQLLARSEVSSFDLIVGPLYYENFKEVAEFANEHNIPLVSPVRQSNKILLGHPTIFKVIPSQTSIVAPLTQLVADSFSTANLLAIEHSTSKEKSLTDMFIDAYNKKLMSLTDSAAHSSFQKIAVTASLEGVIAKLKKDQNNVLFVPSSDQGFVTTFFSQLIGILNNRNYQDCQITVIGLEEWSKFKNIDIEYFQRLNVHYRASQFINDQDSLTNTCVQNYIKRNKTYPSNNTMLGCDLAEYFGKKLQKYGTVMVNDEESFRGKSVFISFFKTGIESGYENIAGVVLRYFDYSIQALPN